VSPNRVVTCTKLVVIHFLTHHFQSVPRGHPVYPRHQGPCTVQFSTCDSSLVVHLVQPRGMASPAPLIRAVLADPTIIKVGCGVNNDVMELQSIWKGTTAQSRLDLGVLFASKGDRPGLKRLCRHIAGVELPKPLHITTSDWSRFPLSYAQVDYAARDAWAGAAMVHALQTVFPDEFATERLVELLQQNEPTIAEIQYRMRRRKQAKSLIRFLHDHYAQAAEKPQWSQELVSKLQVVVREHKHHDKVPELKLPRNLEGWTLE